ncbi:hypothetical protein HDU96_005686 [Phlyctochytrium bullatum]|nr:hypothetical protein HDU96_005686 [Phlyctochytrium bullatum]
MLHPPARSFEPVLQPPAETPSVTAQEQGSSLNLTGPLLNTPSSPTTGTAERPDDLEAELRQQYLSNLHLNPVLRHQDDGPAAPAPTAPNQQPMQVVPSNAEAPVKPVAKHGALRKQAQKTRAVAISDDEYVAWIDIVRSVDPSFRVIGSMSPWARNFLKHREARPLSVPCSQSGRRASNVPKELRKQFLNTFLAAFHDNGRWRTKPVVHWRGIVKPAGCEQRTGGDKQGNGELDVNREEFSDEESSDVDVEFLGVTKRDPAMVAASRPSDTASRLQVGTSPSMDRNLQPGVDHDDDVEMEDSQPLEADSGILDLARDDETQLSFKPAGSLNLGQLVVNDLGLGGAQDDGQENTVAPAAETADLAGLFFLTNSEGERLFRYSQ